MTLNKFGIFREKLDAQQQLAFDMMFNGYELIVKGLGKLGYPVDDENFRETHFRAAKSLIQDFIFEKSYIEEQVKYILSTKFPSDSDTMVIETNIPAVSLCPHHLLPVELRVDIAYIPNKKVVGLSKLPRLVKLLAKQPILQEEYTSNLANTLMNGLGVAGVGVRVLGKHGCMRFRGVNVADSVTTTHAMLGNFRDNESTREEFLSCVTKEFK